jgi:HD-like signal output (HDOD) protein
VSDVGFAVTVVGFSTVRAMSAASAGGLLAGERVVPAGFWENALAVATAGSALAPRAGLSSPDAFSLGLLHDLGSALLFRSDPARFDEVARRASSHTSLCELERDAFGISHNDAGARVFAAWRFPAELVEAVLLHHEPLDPSASAERRVLAAAQAIAARLPSADHLAADVDPEAGLAELGLSPADADALAAHVESEATDLLGAFAD